MNNEKKSWITEDREKIISIYKLIMSERCPGLKPGDEYKKTNEEMLDAILRFVEVHIEAI